MFTSPARLALAAALASGAVLVLPASASAASKQCAVGKWKLTGYSIVRTGSNTATLKGGAGTRLTITPKKFGYDFNGSKKVVLKARIDGSSVTLKSTYRKQLSFKATLKGTKKGKFTLKRKSASGNAVVRSVFTSTSTSTSTQSLAKLYRKGGVDPFVLPSANYTCTAKALKFTRKWSFEDGRSTMAATYRRI